MDALVNKLGNADLAESVDTDELSEVDEPSEEEDAASSDETEEEEVEYKEESDTETVASGDKEGMIGSDDETETETETEAAACGNGKKRKNPDKWLKEVEYYQRTTDLLIPRLPFERLVREIGQDFKADLRFTKDAFSALQTASEDMLVELFAASQVNAIGRKEQTVAPKDFQEVLHKAKRFRWTI